LPTKKIHFKTEYLTMLADCDLKLHFWVLFHTRGFINFPHFVDRTYKRLVMNNLQRFTNLLRINNI